MSAAVGDSEPVVVFMPADVGPVARDGEHRAGAERTAFALLAAALPAAPPTRRG